MKKFIIFFIITFQVIVSIKCQQQKQPPPYSPAPRRLHTAALIDDKIYFLGGIIKEPFDTTNDFFYLDLSKPFDASKKELIPYVDISSEATGIPPHGAAAASVFAKDSIFLFGGQMGSNNTPSNLAFSYNSTQQGWNSVTILSNVVPNRTMTMGSVTDDKNKVYIFGGGFTVSDPALGKDVYKYFNDMKVFDTVSKTWTVMDSGIPGRDGHTSTYLPDTGDIVYIGGFGIADLTNLDVYNTRNNSWRQVPTTNTPESRYGHAAVLTNDGRIIVFGGSPYNNAFVSVKNYYEVLDTKTYIWYPGSDDRSVRAPIIHHTATLYKNYLFIAFGLVSRDQSLSNDLLIYKIGDYANLTQVNKFEINDNIPMPIPNIPSTPVEQSSGNNNGVVIGAILGTILAITVLGLIGFLIFNHRKKNMKGKAYPILPIA